MRTFSLNGKHLQATPGAMGALHTHSRRLDHRPHVHLVMPAAAIDTDKRLWRTKTRHRPPEKALVYLGRYLYHGMLREKDITLKPAVDRFAEKISP